MNHLKMKTIDDAIGVVTEVQVRHSLKEIDNDHAKLQLYAAKLFVEMQREKRIIEEAGIKLPASNEKGMTRKIS